MKSSPTGEWLVNFKGRNHSGASQQNFLWKYENIYIMDNHRAALWCWLQHWNPCEEINLLHIDEHYDCLSSRLDEWLSNVPDFLEKLTIDEYLSLSKRFEPNMDIPVIRWDNYLSLCFKKYPDRIVNSIFATHNEGDKPKVRHAQHVQPWDLPNNIDFWISNHPSKWIINIDLDYFFCRQENRKKLMFSEEYIRSIFLSIKSAFIKDRVSCITLCLTPDEDYTGGWEQAEALCNDICEILSVPFALP